MDHQLFILFGDIAHKSCQTPLHLYFCRTILIITQEQNQLLSFSGLVVAHQYLRGNVSAFVGILPDISQRIRFLHIKVNKGISYFLSLQIVRQSQCFSSEIGSDQYGIDIAFFNPAAHFLITLLITLTVTKIIHAHIKRTQLLTCPLDATHYRMPVVMFYIIRYQADKGIFLLGSQSDSKYIRLVMDFVQYLLYFSFALGRYVAAIVQHSVNRASGNTRHTGNVFDGIVLVLHSAKT